MVSIYSDVACSTHDLTLLVTAVQLVTIYRPTVAQDLGGDHSINKAYDHISAHQLRAEVYEDEYFSIKYFMKRSAHLTFKKPSLMGKMNDIIAKHYPELLPERV